ncbi:hypothetical protein FP828_05445 [bacterium]|nr:hypothetical protein [bacterium]
MSRIAFTFSPEKIIFVFVVYFLPANFLFSYEGNLSTPIAVSHEGHFLSPEYSPDGSMIAYSGAKYRGIHIYDIKTGKNFKLTDGWGDGYGFSFSSDGENITFLSREGKLKKIKKVNIKTKKSDEIYSSAKKTGLPFWHKDDSISFTIEGELQYRDSRGNFRKGRKGVKGHSIAFFQDSPVILEEDHIKINNNRFSVDGRYYSIKVSETGGILLMHLIENGHIYVLNLINGKITDIGKGYAGNFSPDGKWVIANISEDDGHKIISSELWLLKSDGKKRIQITNTDDRMEMYPAFSPDGK